jgi:hypothetical protein
MERTAKTAPVDHWANQTISAVLPRVVGFGALRLRRYQSRRFRELRIRGTTRAYGYQPYLRGCLRGNTTDRCSKPQVKPVLDVGVCGYVAHYPQPMAGPPGYHHYNSGDSHTGKSGVRWREISPTRRLWCSSKRAYLATDLPFPGGDRDCPEAFAGGAADFPLPVAASLGGLGVFDYETETASLRGRGSSSDSDAESASF